jgi:ABC-type phosphate transport system permease subunit
MCPPMLKRPLGTAVELLAAIPSIIYGMWGLFVFAPLVFYRGEQVLGGGWIESAIREIENE